MKGIDHPRYGMIAVKRHYRASYVRLSVSPAGNLSISAPAYTPIRFIRLFINKSSAEIEKLLRHHRVLYAGGDRIGKSHSLTVDIGPAAAISYKKPHIRLSLPAELDIEDHSVQQLIKPMVIKALRTEAKAYLPRRVDYLATQHDFGYQKLRLSHAKSRWGSCSSQRTISLNIALMKLDFPLIDYVILHELAHTKQLNHSPHFWQLVEQGDPDYKRHRKELKQHSPHI